MNVVRRIRDSTRPFRKRLRHPKHYVKTDDTSGRLQFELLKMEGCRPDSKVLEIGCGCLHAGVHLMRYLEQGNFVGIDPNEWLRNRVLRKASIRQLVNDSQARFLSVTDFDASQLGIKFDYILSHSILSHAAHWQLPQYLQNAAKVLTPEGRIVASLRLAEGNDFGSLGTPDGKDSLDEEWVYPGVSYFTMSTVNAEASKFGLAARYAREYTEYYVRERPNEVHDWFVFRRTGCGTNAESGEAMMRVPPSLLTDRSVA